MSWWESMFGRGKRSATKRVGAVAQPRPGGTRGRGVEGLPSFRSGASERLAPSGSDPLARARMRLRDAFTPSQPVADPRMFAGRAELLERLIRAIEDQRLHVVLFGERGIGKTSILRVLAEQATQARYLVRYVSCGEETDFADLFASIAGTIPLLYHAGHSPGAPDAERGATLTQTLAGRRATPRVVSEILGDVEGTRILIVLDEFDRSPPGTFRRQVAELIKNLSDRSARVQLVIAGVAANLTELVEHIPSIRRNILGVSVPGMTADEVGELIRKGERAGGVSFEGAAVRAVDALATGSPYLVGLLAQHAAIAAVDRGSERVEVADVAEAVRRAADEIAGRVSEESRHGIARAIAGGHAGVLQALAGAALRHGGRLEADALAGVVPEQRRAEVWAALGDYGLVEVIPGDPLGRRRFSEDGVAVHLWMSAARDRPPTS